LQNNEKKKESHQVFDESEVEGDTNTERMNIALLGSMTTTMPAGCKTAC
jgi:hypothetical protein